MIAITVEDVERAEAAAGAAQERLREAERAYADTPTPSTYQERQEALEAVDLAGLQVRLARERWGQRQAEREARAAAGEAAAREMTEGIAGLVSSREGAVQAVGEAVAAMGRALNALEAHDGAVRAVSEELRKRGLRRIEEEATGAGLDGSVWIRGQLWPLVDGGSVVGRLLVDMVAARQGRHPLARVAWQPYGGVTAGRGRDEVLALVRAERGR